jgi:hypothetical protein
MRLMLLTVLLATALSIGACSKCDFPVWQSYSACRAGPPPGS